MYASLAFVLVVALVVGGMALAFRFRAWQDRALGKLVRKLALTDRETVFDGGRRSKREILLCLRLWILVGLVLFAILGLRHGALIQNRPVSMAMVLAFGCIGMAVSGVLLLSLLAYAWFLPGLKASLGLCRFGVRGLWLTGAEAPRDLREGLAKRCRSAKRIAVLDVTGYELLAKGPGPESGLLFDVLAKSMATPVSLLLLKPHAEAPDPEAAETTVFHSVLDDLGISPPNYLKRLRLTLQAVQLLNAERSKEAQISVRFYNEKPAVRAIICDDSMYVSPWPCRDEDVGLAILDLARDGNTPSLFETFRRHFARLWAQSVDRIALQPSSSRRLQEAMQVVGACAATASAP